MEEKVKEFCDLLQGKYDNWQQASSNPRIFSHVMLCWDRLSDNELKIKQWYVHEGESKPYRERWHRVLTDPETSAIIVENWSDNFETHNQCCDMTFDQVDNSYEGSIIGNDCMVRGATVKSHVSFNGRTYSSMDQGWLGDTLVWGSKNIYKFHKVS